MTRKTGRTLALALGVVAGTVLAPTTARAQAVTLGPYTETWTDFNPCTGETVLGTTNTRIAVYAKVDTSGTHYTFRILINGSGVSDPLLATEKRYQFSNENISEANAAPGSSMEQSNVINHMLIRTGNSGTTLLPSSTDDFIEKTRVHFTINAQGIVTADVARFESGCPNQK